MDATLYIEKELSVKDKKLEMVKEFNKTYEIPIRKKPSLTDEDEYNLKHDLMNAVVDMMYILYGIILSHGLSEVIFDMFEEVHKSNMSKLENGKVLRRADGKIMKGSEYFKPNLNQFL